MARSGPLQREIQTLVRGLLVFLAALIAALLLLVLSMLGMNRPAAMGDEVLTAIAPLSRASRSDLQARLNLLVGENGITRIEIYRDERLYAGVGGIMPSAEVVSRNLPGGGRMLIYFDMSGWMGGRNNRRAQRHRPIDVAPAAGRGAWGGAAVRSAGRICGRDRRIAGVTHRRHAPRNRPRRIGFADRHHHRSAFRREPIPRPLRA